MTDFIVVSFQWRETVATRIDLPKEAVRHAIELKVGSLKRAEKTQTNPLMRELIQKDIALYMVAMNTITETK